MEVQKCTLNQQFYYKHKKIRVSPLRGYPIGVFVSILMRFSAHIWLKTDIVQTCYTVNNER